MKKRPRAGVVFDASSKRERGRTPVLQAALERLVLTEEMVNTAMDLLGRIDQENVDSYLTHVSGQALAGLDETARWCIVWELLLQSLKAGCLDSRIHVSIHRLATLLHISLDVGSLSHLSCHSPIISDINPFPENYSHRGGMCGVSPREVDGEAKS